jgi:hypothetical protein
MMAIGGLFTSVFANRASQLTGAGQAISMPISNGGTGGMFGGLASAPPMPPSQMMQSDIALSRLEAYMELCGDKLEYVHVGKNIETKDPKVSILKLANVGEFVKNVGLKYSENTYYIIREQE